MVPLYNSFTLPGLVGLKISSLFCTKFGSGCTRSIMSSLGLRELARGEERMTPGLGLEVGGPSTSSKWPPPIAGGFTCPTLESFSSRLSSSESIVSSKNWRHSCSSRLRNFSVSSSYQGKETAERLVDIVCFHSVFMGFFSVQMSIPSIQNNIILEVLLKEEARDPKRAKES